jgi:hypothetical protein
MGRQQVVKARQMDGLMPLHLGQLAGYALVTGNRTENSALTAIDMDGSQLPGMVNPQDLGQTG